LLEFLGKIGENLTLGASTEALWVRAQTDWNESILPGEAHFQTGGYFSMAKKAATKAAPGTGGSSSAKPATKGEIYTKLAEKTQLSKKQISTVFESLTELIGNELGKKGPGMFIVPGLLKLKVVKKPATKAKQGINPFTKQPMMYKAKPARNVVKALPLKPLKEMV
jgi:nucleoid DNA-binding protein